MKIEISTLRELTRKTILQYGYTEEEANRILEVLMYAQLRGNNQGVVKLIGAGIPKSPRAQAPEVLRETPVSAWIDAHETHAMVVMNQAVDQAIAKVKQHGIALIGVNHINTSSGALGYYVRRLAQAGYVGMMFAGSMETVAVTGSYQPMLGTNPLAFAIPTAKDEPFVFDMATAAMAYFGVVEAHTAGTSLPEGVAYDKEGNVTTIPAKVLDDGALRTFDAGYKGTGLSMMVQMLTGPLLASYFTGVGDVATNWGGHLLLAFNPDLFGGLEAVQQGSSQMIAAIKASRPLPGVTEILVPGERGDTLMKQALASGIIDIEDRLYEALQRVVTKAS